MEKHLIWWTNQSDHERVALLTIDWPPYLANEFRSREGRVGRGRLWVASELDDDTDLPRATKWEDSDAVCRIASDAAGIVIRSADYECVRGLPGFVTDFSMNLIR